MTAHGPDPGAEPSGPFPGPATALWLTLGAWLATVVVTGLLAPSLGPVAAAGIGLAVGLGLTGSLALRRVPPPQPERLGLRGLGGRAVLAVLLLVPLVLLVSELDNLLRAVLPALPPPELPEGAEVAPSAEELAQAPALLVLELAIVSVGLAPVLQEFFFRGVLQQGLVSTVGARRAVVGCAALFALSPFHLLDGPGSAFSATLGSLVLGLVYGYARLATGSLLAPILISMLGAGAGLLALRFEAALPIPGFNAGGDHTPAAWLVPAAVSVALGLWLLAQERARREEKLLPVFPPEDRRED